MHNLGNHERESSMNRLRVVSAAEWRAAREELLVKEKEATRTRDALAAERRRLPMVKVEKDYLWSFLDLTSLGRQVTWEDSPGGYPQDPPCSWWHLRDEYDA
jgi:predicted dithiol-disulfide oxidoreductase (DUF899 family)